MSSFHDLSAAGEQYYSLCLKNERLNDTFFFSTRGLSSAVVLRLRAHSTSRNPVPVAAPQRTRVVYAGFLYQSLHPDNRRFADCRIVFRSSKHHSASVVPDFPSSMHLRALIELYIAVSYGSVRVLKMEN
jgi:hypothetical protein